MTRTITIPRPHHRWAAAVIALAATLSCDSLTELKHSLRGQDTAGLRLQVEPSKGITVTLDGASVGVEHTAEMRLAPGVHTVEIRARGYHDFALSVELPAGTTLTIPIALRAIKVKTPTPRPTTAVSPSTATRKRTPNTLPPGVAPLSLGYATIPAVSVYVDNTAASSGKLVIGLVRGTIRAGDITLTYHRRAGDVLDLFVPEENALWQRDDNIVLAGNSFQAHAGETRISRVAADGAVQTLMLLR